MKRFLSALVYTALGPGAIAAVILVAAVQSLPAQTDGHAASPQPGPQRLAEIREMREGSMRKLILHPGPKARADIPHTDPDGTRRSLTEYRGKHVLVNFWATWCAPCRKEMGSLDRLQAELQSDRFEVVTIATYRNPLPAITRFFREEGIANLPILLDPQGALAAEYGLLGLPLSVVLNPDGREIARLIGDAEWDSESARKIFGMLADD